MPFDSILGQEPAVQTLTRALLSGHVHHAYRFEGPAGVGKELAAFALAQGLVCEAGEPLGCGKCGTCHRAVTLSEDEPRVPLHPDVILIGRALYPPSVVSASESSGISVEQIRRVVLARAGFPPHEGRALVFIVRDAEELTAQAANALLKTLEEPAPRTHFVLLTSRPSRLLDTVLSRTLAVRFGPLPDDVIAKILAARGAPAEVAPIAQGSAALALELADEERMQARSAFGQAVLEALSAPDLATAIGVADKRSSDRDALRDQLGYLAHTLAGRCRDTIATAPALADREARRHAEVLRALGQLERNVQPALVVESMIARLRRA